MQRWSVTIEGPNPNWVNKLAVTFRFESVHHETDDAWYAELWPKVLDFERQLGVTFRVTDIHPVEAET